MSIFSDEAIEARLLAAIDPVIEGAKHGCSSFDGLDFEDSGEEYGLNAYWDGRESCWDGPTTIDPLSLLLIAERSERESVHRDDNEVVHTLAAILNRPAKWVYSFQDGWYGRSNTNTSITGYLLGRKLRLKYKG